MDCTSSTLSRMSNGSRRSANWTRRLACSKFRSQRAITDARPQSYPSLRSSKAAILFLFGVSMSTLVGMLTTSLTGALASTLTLTYAIMTLYIYATCKNNEFALLPICTPLHLRLLHRPRMSFAQLCIAPDRSRSRISVSRASGDVPILAGVSGDFGFS